MHVPALRTDTGALCLLELDHPGLLAEQLHVDAADPVGAGFLQIVASELMETLSPDVSGVVLSSESSYYALEQKAQHTGVIFSLEKQIEMSEPLSVPTLTANWGIVQTRNNYALAKVQLSYHPQEKLAVQKLQLVAELAEYAHHEGIDFVLELTPVHEGDLEQVLLQSIGEFKSLVDLLVLPPTSSLTAVTITAELDAPWIMAQREGSYDQYKEQLRVCLESGAVGFLAGAAVWGDLWAQVPELTDAAARRKLMETAIRDRFVELGRITAEMVGKAI